MRNLGLLFFAIALITQLLPISILNKLRKKYAIDSDNAETADDDSGKAVDDDSDDELEPEEEFIVSPVTTKASLQVVASSNRGTSSATIVTSPESGVTYKSSDGKKAKTLDRDNESKATAKVSLYQPMYLTAAPAGAGSPLSGEENAPDLTAVEE